MSTVKLVKAVASTGFALAMSFGLSSVASAAPSFTVDPSSLGFGTVNNGNTFEADQINGIMSSLVTYDDATKTTSGGGYIQFNGFGMGNQAVGAGKTGVTVAYDLYVTYTFTSNVTGVFGAVGEDQLTSLNYTLWAAAVDTTVFTSADALTNTMATAVNGGAIALGSGALLQGVTGFNSQGGAYVNSSASYANTATGDDYFIAPNPFYDLAFNSFNNTIQGVAANGAGNVISVNQAIGNIDFGASPTEVPEPISLALFGMGLFGVCFATRRRQS